MSLHQFSSEEANVKDDFKTSESQNPTLVLDEDSIYLSETPHDILYKLSTPLKGSQAKEYAIKKVGRGEDTIRSELFHIKDESETVPENGFGLVTIKNEHDSKAKPVDLVSSAQTWSKCSAAGHFKVESGIIDQVKGNEERKWKDEGGRFLLDGTRVERIRHAINLEKNHISHAGGCGHGQ
ncbi:hypothetical protein NW762_014602 [Fusarium torreyae]|uniref:Uncharacterized protein n=1 Tax=Fusarium torreyae TaxID=1237075 RepID=A0A9W8RLZ6_9HYPO|nr:hypothetical protein NW762_014602 [Fusarium torreyae]